MSEPQFNIGSPVWNGLSKLIEECGEVGQVCGKIIGAHPNLDHWDGTNLAQRLMEELGDVQAAIRFLYAHSTLISRDIIERRADEKFELFQRWNFEQFPRGEGSLPHPEEARLKSEGLGSYSANGTDSDARSTRPDAEIPAGPLVPCRGCGGPVESHYEMVGELLDALRRIEALMSSGPAATDIARAAIAKATGQ